MVLEFIEWKFIPGFDDKYLVSNTGVIKSKRIDGHYEEIKYNKCGGEYWHFHCRKRGEHKHKWVAVHRVVAFLFVPNSDPSKYTVVNHLDGNKLNNCADNLEWCTIRDNILHARDVLKVLRNKLTIEDADKIRLDVLNGKYIHINDIAKKYGAEVSTIRNILSNKILQTESSYPVEIPCIKLSRVMIKQLREEYNSDLELSIRDLAKRYKLKESRVRDIIRNVRYHDPNYTYDSRHKYICHKGRGKRK